MQHIQAGDPVMNAARVAAFTRSLAVGLRVSIAASTTEVPRGFVFEATVSQVFRAGDPAETVGAILDLGPRANARLWPFTGIPGFELHDASVVNGHEDFIATIQHGDARAHREIEFAVYEPLSYAIYFEGATRSERERNFITLQGLIRGHFDRREPRAGLLNTSRSQSRKTTDGSVYLTAHLLHSTVTSLLGWARYAMEGPGDWRAPGYLIQADNTLATLSIFEVYFRADTGGKTAKVRVAKCIIRLNKFLQTENTIRGRVGLAVEHALAAPDTGNGRGGDEGDL